MSEKAQILSWITCDGVHVDAATGKYYLLGVFSSLRGAKFPIVHPRMFWFLTLCDVATGNHTLRISLGIVTETPVPIVKRDFESRSPLQRIHIINEINNMKFQKPGDYSVLIEIDDEIVLASSFPVLE